MLAGSYASGEHGVPRSTHDFDFVINPSQQGLGLFIRLLTESGFYVSREAAEDALARRTQFNAVDENGSWKADLIIRKDRAFSRAEFERKIPRTIAGVPLFIATAEDTILAKLEWAKMGSSEQQLNDVRGILEIQADLLDQAYIERWLDDLGVRDLWESLSAR